MVTKDIVVCNNAMALIAPSIVGVISPCHGVFAVEVTNPEVSEREVPTLNLSYDRHRRVRGRSDEPRGEGPQRQPADRQQVTQCFLQLS